MSRVADGLPADAAWRDPSPPVEERVAALLQVMTLAEKFGQMTLVEKGSIDPDGVGTRRSGAGERRWREPA